MYSRPREDFGISLPGDYCGTAFQENEVRQENEALKRKSDNIGECAEVKDKPSGRHSTGISSLFSQLPLFSRLGDFGLSVPTFGAEDILIIATAAFLFFSKTGDKECAIMLLLLIFIAN